VIRRISTRYFWSRLKVSFWFTPVVMALIAILLASVMYRLDEIVPNAALDTSRFFITGTVSELRGFLLSMSTTVLATAGVVFTLLTLPLSTVVSQYGSRLLRVFLGDRITQIVLGMFVASFVYCVSAATSIPPPSVEPESPQITTTFGLFLLLATFSSLILLIQHISTMLQAPHIAAAAGAELMEVINTDIEDTVPSSEDDWHFEHATKGIHLESDGFPIKVKSTGYVEYIDIDHLVSLARAYNLVFRVLGKPGQFVWRGTAIILAWPAATVSRHIEKLILRDIHIGKQRTPTQDIECAVNRLSEMAIRAMSPAINDPFTAMTCMDYLGNGLALFAKKGRKHSEVLDQDGQLRLIFQPLNFETVIVAAFEMLSHASNNNAHVLEYMLAVVDSIGQATQTPGMRQTLAHQVKRIQAESQTGAITPEDRLLIRDQCKRLVGQLNKT